MREISCYGYTQFEFLFSAGCVTVRLSLVQYGACAPSDSRSCRHAHGCGCILLAFIALYNRYTYEIILCGGYACELILRAGTNPRDTKNALNIS
jgi:hypothetical protein